MGEALNKAFNKIEDLNPRLYGVFDLKKKLIFEGSELSEKIGQ